MEIILKKVFSDTIEVEVQDDSELDDEVLVLSFHDWATKGKKWRLNTELSEIFTTSKYLSVVVLENMAEIVDYLNRNYIIDFEEQGLVKLNNKVNLETKL